MIAGPYRPDAGYTLPQDGGVFRAGEVVGGAASVALLKAVLLTNVSLPGRGIPVPPEETNRMARRGVTRA